MQEFELRIVSTDNNNFALDLYQCAYRRAGEKRRPAAQQVGRLQGVALVTAREAIYAHLRRNDCDPKTLNHRRVAPYVLEEKSGVSLALLFQAVAPLEDQCAIASICNGIMSMSDEEVCYWYAKVVNDTRRPVLKALRILLGEVVETSPD